MTDKHKTKVIFRKFKDGEIIAIFPELQANENKQYCMSYLHVGQHGAADYCLINGLKPATPEEFASLKEELESIGYNLEVKKRISRRWYQVEGPDQD
jgi:hypothetical protein